jgi:hypothetical protein
VREPALLAGPANGPAPLPAPVPKTVPAFDDPAPAEIAASVSAEQTPADTSAPEMTLPLPRIQTCPQVGRREVVGA